MKTFAFILLVILSSVYANNPMKSDVPIGAFSQFTCLNKSSNKIEIKTTIPHEIILNQDFINTVLDEFINSKTNCIYQSKLIAIPENENVQIEIINVDSVTISTPNPPVFSSPPSQTNEPFAFIGKPGLMRDIRVAPLVIRQYRYDNITQKIICYKTVNIKVNSQANFPTISEHNHISQSWSQLYQNTLLNYEENSFHGYNFGVPQGYLIIVADALYNGILPLAQWKNQKGWTVTIKRTSEIGSSANDFRNYIQQAYNTLTPKIEYVLLVGTVNLIPANSIYAIGDHIYSCVSGADLYPDLFIGRLPAANTSELGIMVAKIIGYEQAPWLTDTLWYQRAAVVATTYQSSGVPVWTALATSRWVRSLFLQNNYLRVDTIFDPPYANGVGIIDTIINNGISYINGRGWGNREGWDRPSFKIPNVYSLTNGWKLPVVTSFYCATGNYNAYPTRCFGEAWLLAGTPTVPKGGIAFYGTTYPITSTRYNNCQSYYVYWGILEEDIYNCGPAVFNGKIGMLNNFPMVSDSEQVRIHTVSYNLLGDPSLEMWDGVVPKQLTATYPTQLPVGSSQISVTVRNASNQPIEGALVSLLKTNEVKVVGYTNNLGIASFNFTTQTQDTLFVTVTKHNFVPHRGFVQISPSAIYVGYYSHSGNIIAGQSDNLFISLKNYGASQSATNTNATLRSSDNRIVITDSVKSYGTITPNQIQSGGPYQFTVAINCTNNHKINFQLSINSGNNNWQAGFNCFVRAAELSYKSHNINDGNNGLLEPGETANLIVKIYNRGLENINNVSALLRSANPYAIQITDSIGYFGVVNVGDSIQNTTDFFTLRAASSIAVGRRLFLQLVLRSTNYERIIEFPIIIGNISSTSPLGPDQYGYWAYDNTDTQYSERPIYNWVEIDPNYGGAGIRLAMSNHSIRRVNLPFNFKYYGRNYNRISVASNGYMAMDSTWIIDPYNWSIPSPMGPPAMIAPFWDDFHPETLSSSGIYYFNDAVNHRFIIQWSRIHHIHGFRNPYPAELQTFQVILQNPQFYQTHTGDGPIIFQYHTVVNDDSFPVDCHNYATVGIESHTLEDGIEYSFANQYPLAAAMLDNGRAIKFTTNRPDTFTAIVQVDQTPSLQSNTFYASPNPTKNLTLFNYSLSYSSNVSLKLYDINGKVIETLITPQVKNMGNYQLAWKRGNIPAGIYFAVLNIDNNQVYNKKVKLILN